MEYQTGISFVLPSFKPDVRDGIMQKSDLHKRNMQLSKLVLLASQEKIGRVGFLKAKGEIRVPENFNDLHSEKMEALFNGKG